MVSYVIVDRLDPAIHPLITAAKSRNSAFLFSFGRNCPEFRDFAAAVSGRSAGSGHVTIAKHTILDTSDF